MKNMPHQDEALAKGRDQEFFAYFMDPGTGKTRVGLLDALHNYQKGEVEALLVMAPNSVKTGWVCWPHMLEPGEQDQVSVHLGDEHIIKGVWVSSATGADKKAWKGFEDRLNKRTSELIILSINYEALLSPDFHAFLIAFCKRFKTMALADESTRLGNAKAQRTKQAWKIARVAVKRRILSGTPIIKTPMKIFSQAQFLKEWLLGFRSYFAFRGRYAIMGGFEGRQIMSFKNLDELSDKIAAFSYRARKEDCLKFLPPQIFSKRRVEHTPEQAKAYKEMRQEFRTIIKDQEITANIVLTQILRLQQINSGFVTKDGEVVELIPPHRNPKLTEALEIIKAAPGQCVVWFRFRPELDMMARLIERHNKTAAVVDGDEPKISFVEFHGDTQDKVRVRKDFKAGKYDILLGTQDAGGIGVDEFKVADTVVFITNTPDTETRKQAEDRNHRIGSEQHECVNYYDIIIPQTVDAKVLKIISGDMALSAKVMRDGVRDWL